MRLSCQQAAADDPRGVDALATLASVLEKELLRCWTRGTDIGHRTQGIERLAWLLQSSIVQIPSDLLSNFTLYYQFDSSFPTPPVVGSGVNIFGPV